jgi:hypothetical protein
VTISFFLTNTYHAVLNRNPINRLQSSATDSETATSLHGIVGKAQENVLGEWSATLTLPD